MSEQVAIYAIATRDDPDTIRYVGSAIDPAKRLRGHRRGQDSGRTKAWFLANSDRLICYVIEWVDARLRLNAEAYWYRKFDTIARSAGYRLVNYPWFEAVRRAASYGTDVAFDTKAAPFFMHTDGATWSAVSATKRKW